ncbi:hypothetical protein SAMN02746065_107114 [Desulfocicer vacuolatum DSM 3385]|uniref:Uncharacterized protein n=1 Tax=Desulfocicer vacuolatum DSM 3385 TaxID=1121400 RepID=A0A1W2B982_9BACT|nr:hypothetical protein [Desulfocicer vacuolatum]SMC69262.1 hypothetical protein SAMN02746065_107114 [Desulfocicer vacuolatum DSM 3385]
MDINKFTFLGIVSWIGGLGILLFQGIAQAMDKDNQWTTLFLGGLTGDFLGGLPEKIPVEILQTGLNFIMYEMPFYQVLLGVGGIFVLLGMFIND